MKNIIKTKAKTMHLAELPNLRLQILTDKRVGFPLSEGGMLHIPLEPARGNIFETTMVVAQRMVVGEQAK